MTKGLKKKDGTTDIQLKSLDADDVQILNKKFSWLKLDKATTLDTNTFIQKKKESASSIATYLGAQGHQLPKEWTIEGSNLNFKGKTSPPTFLNDVTISNWDTYANKTAGKTTGYTISFEQLKNILNPTATPST